MADYDPSTYGDRIAEIYDELNLARTDSTAAVDFLAPMAGGRRVLELGIGTGRIALPLAARGIKVHGIDASPAMVKKMRLKPGGTDIPVEMGSFANVRTAGRFSLIYVVFNTFFSLPTQEDQVRCLRSVAKRLTPDGAFVIEAFVPDLALFKRQRTSPMLLSDERTVLVASQLDLATQRVRAQVIVITDNAVHRYPIELRYAWPAELDLMARLAGMRLRQRFGGWDRSPFTPDSRVHVSVYEPAATPVVMPIGKAKRTPLKIVPGKRKRRA